MIQRLLPLHVPDVLKMNDGTPVTLENFEQRREEIIEMMQKEIYGTYPEKTKDISIASIEDRGDIYDGKATYEIVNLKLGFKKGDFTFPIPLFMPKGVEKPACIVTVGSAPDARFF